MIRNAALFAALASLCPSLMADGPSIPLDIHGYFRAGSGTSSEGGEMAAFQLPGAPSKYRLGNEAEDYGEFQADAQVYQAAGTTFKAHVMANFYHQFSTGSENTGVGSTSAVRDFDMNQYWVEGIGILGDGDVLKGASLWAGKRYYNRNENHIEITDFFYWNDYANGLGLENVNLGFAKFHYAYLQYDNSNDLTPTTLPSSAVGQNVVTSHAFRLADWHINPGGSLELGVTVKKARPYASVADASNSQNGLELNIQHKQAGILGGDNMFGLQYGDGCASTLDQPPGGNPALGSGNKAWRIVDALTVERTGHYAMQATAVYQSTTDPSGARQVWTSIGGRPMVFLTRSFSLVADLGLDRIKYATDAAASAGTTGQLLKTTLAAVWRPEPKFWSVPQFRLFVTNAQWNAAAAAAGPIANNNFGTRTNGLNYGLQGELWW